MLPLPLSVGQNAESCVLDSQQDKPDWSLASASLVSQVAGLTAWHIHAGGPDLVMFAAFR